MLIIFFIFSKNLKIEKILSQILDFSWESRFGDEEWLGEKDRKSQPNYSSELFWKKLYESLLF